MLLKHESFDNLGTGSTGAANLQKKGWSYNGNNIVTGRNGNAAATGGFVPQLNCTASTTDQTAYVGMAWKWHSASGYFGVYFYENGTKHCGMIFDPATSKVIGVNGAGTGQGAYSSWSLPLNTWVFLEVGAYIHDAAGWVEIRINEATVYREIFDTKNGGTGFINTIAMNQNSGVGVPAEHYIDDFYWADSVSTGAPNEVFSFIGDCQVESRLAVPDATAAGTYATLTPSTGTDHGALVDETTPNATDYNFATSVGSKDTYQMQDLVATDGVIYGVNVCAYARKTAAGERTMAPLLRSGSTDYLGTSQSLNAVDWLYNMQLYRAHPDGTNPWTVSSVNATEFGAQLTA